MSSIRSEQVVVSVPHYIEQTVFDVSNWKLPLRVRFPHVPIFNCRRRTNCENFDVENKKVKFALLEASEINFASIANLFEILFNCEIRKNLKTQLKNLLYIILTLIFNSTAYLNLQ